ncbi:hypothetical protein GSI_03232 [Ganoderma sinense ZZ0214-1]|uniref:Uncharacterized protein n=1 Tax=Ganoderma sinense ZZ0214-1 TaxID=1077348 RepID=A0A2G8SL09_9APHY|nr:hypothetical protein GSI_03232 [Ganoderma sinense ZZ0214-1]
MSCESSSDIKRLLSLMRAVGQNVTYISLDLANLGGVRLPLDLNWAVLGESLACCPWLESLHVKISTFGKANYSGMPCHALFTTILPYASRLLHTLTVELVDDVHWRYPTGGFGTWDLNVLAAYLTRKPVEFPALRSVAIELRMVFPDDNENLEKVLLQELSPLKDAGLLCIFCDDMS